MTRRILYAAIMIPLLLAGCAGAPSVPTIEWNRKNENGWSEDYLIDSGTCELEWLKSKSLTPAFDIATLAASMLADVAAETDGTLSLIKLLTYWYKRDGLKTDGENYIDACMRSKGHKLGDNAFL